MAQCLVSNGFYSDLSILRKSCDTMFLFRKVFILMSVFLARPLTESFVYNGFYTNFSILRKACDTVLGLKWFLQEFQ